MHTTLTVTTTMPHLQKTTRNRLSEKFNPQNYNKKIHLFNSKKIPFFIQNKTYESTDVCRQRF